MGDGEYLGVSTLTQVRESMVTVGGGPTAPTAVSSPSRSWDDITRCVWLRCAAPTRTKLGEVRGWILDKVEDVWLRFLIAGEISCSLTPVLRLLLGIACLLKIRGLGLLFILFTCISHTSDIV